MVYTDRITENITFSWADFRYKRERLVIEHNCELRKETMTGISLLAYVLSSATDSLRDIVSLSRYLDMLYGASLYVSASRSGNRMIMHFDTDNVSGLYLTEKDNGYKAAKLLCDIMTDPFIPGGRFPDETVEIEKEKLREEIGFMINNKESYCTRMLLRKFFADTPRGLPEIGFAEDIPGITSDWLYTLYLDCLRRCNINVFYCGSDLDRVRNLVTDTFLESGMGTEPVVYDQAPAAMPAEPFEIKEELGTEQDIFSILFHTGRIPDPHDLAALKVANSILGGMPTSRLFMNVRERQGLCYNCVSNRMTAGGAGILIESSTSPDKYQRNLDSVLNEFRNLAEKGPSGDELAQAKLSINNSLKGIADTVSGVSSHYLSSINSIGRYTEPEHEMSLIGAVTAGDVKRILSEMRYCGSYRIHDEQD